MLARPERFELPTRMTRLGAVISETTIMIRMIMAFFEKDRHERWDSHFGKLQEVQQ